MMKYTTQVTINLPRTRVIELFDSIENMHKWQEGLKSFTVISGNPGEEGCRSEWVHEGRKDDLEMIETITKRNLPDELHGVYKARGVYNEMHNFFSEKDLGKTVWLTVNVFKFRGLMALMASFMKAAFANNTLLNMERFKSFAEKSG